MQLPLFPLQTVLFPRAPVRLHVFEDRYKEMMLHCIDEASPFGVVLIKSGTEAGGPLPDPHLIGCTAVITKAAALANGDLNIEAVGTERFRILSLVPGQPYLVAHVETLAVQRPDEEAMALSGTRLRRWLERYLAVLSTASGEDIDPTSGRLPADPLALAYVAASVLPLPSTEKQALLAERRADSLVDDVCALYRRELPILETMVAGRDDVLPGPFSRN
ncbi:MAG: LON peptidase substrate-binding domain-containing protein [Anaerolineae bacterium]